MTKKQTNANPFDDLSLVQEYEDWYTNQGHRADRLEKKLLEWLIGHFQEPISILDVGCGTGHFTRFFETLGVRAVGLDISPAMLVEARRHGLRVAVQGDALRLPFEDGAVDLIAMITTIEFLEDPSIALREATRVAKKGLILGVINRKSWIGREYQQQGGPPWKSAHFFTPDELIQMLGTIKDSAFAPFWRTTLWRFLPWALPLPWGGFIGIGLHIKSNNQSFSPALSEPLLL
ncbi:MAG: methyltransferase domain-containing protein [Chloroflexota bacterium]|nr:methyltransferase domain-containing protein [Chloroflexota bacterium]